MSERHVLFGSAPPSITPETIGQHYVDLSTREVYTSRGITTPADWGSPIATLPHYQAIKGVVADNLDALEKLADSLGDDPDFSDSIDLLLLGKLGTDQQAVLEQYALDAIAGATPDLSRAVVELITSDHMLTSAEVNRYLRVGDPVAALIRIPMDLTAGNPEIYFEALDAGAVRIYGQAGVTLDHLDIFHPVIYGKHGVVSMKQISPNHWVLSGALILSEGVTLEEMGAYVELMNTILNFPESQPNLLASKNALGEVPSEIFFLMPRGVMSIDGSFTLSPTINASVFSYGVPSAATKIYLASNTPAFDVIATGHEIGATSIVVDGHIVSTQAPYWNITENWETGTSVAIASATNLTNEAHNAMVAALPPTIDVAWPHVANFSGGTVINTEWPEAGGTYVGMRPMGDQAYPDFTFVDNLGPFGYSTISLDTWWNPAAGMPPEADRNFFSGILKRSAIGKKVIDILLTDIVAGILQVGTSAKFVVNGIVEQSRNDVSLTGSEPRLGITLAAPDQSAIPIHQRNTALYNFSEVWSDGGTGSSNAVNWTGSYVVNMAEGVLAGISDLDIRGLGEAPWNVDGVTEFNVLVNRNYYGDGLKGLTFRH